MMIKRLLYLRNTFASLAVLLVLLVSGDAVGQQSIVSTSTVTQNFTIGTSTTATLPSGFKIGIDWSTGTTATTQAYGSAGTTGAVTSSSSGGAVNWANGVNGSSTERAIGFLSSNSYTSPRSIIYAFTNNTGSTVTSIDLTWNYEKYRSGSRAFNWTFFHGNTSTPNTSDSAGDQAYAANADNTVISNPPLSAAKSFSITGLSIANGTTYYLRWTYTGVGGNTNAQGLAIDDFSIKLNTAVTPTEPTIAVTPTASLSLGNTICQGSTGTGSYTVTGSNLTADIELTPTAQIEISTTSDFATAYSSTSNPKLKLTPSSGSVNQIIYVRSVTTLPAEAFTGSISHTSTDATPVTKNISGTVIAPQTPTISIAQSSGATSPMCGSQSITFTATTNNLGGGTASLQWKRNGNNVGTSSTYTLSTPTDNDVITCEITNVTNGCVTSTTATSNSITLTVNSLPAAPTGLQSNSPNCLPAGVIIYSSSSAPEGITWYWQGTNSNGTATTNNQATYNAVASGTYYIRARNNTTGCWSASASIAVVVNSQISSVSSTPSPNNNNTSVCYSGDGAVNTISWSTASGATSYDVYFGAGSLPGTPTTNVTTTSYNVGTLLASTTYSWKIVPRNGCGETTGTPITWSFTTRADLCFCLVSGGTSNSGILRVQFNTIDETTPSNVGYTDKTSVSTNVMQGAIHNLTVNVNTNGNYTSYIVGWIDWNQNGTFEVSERYQLGTVNNNTNGQQTLAITVPAGAMIGSTRMRISANTQNNTINTYAGPCESFTHGEVEDYTINVIAACEAPTVTLQAIPVTAIATETVSLHGNVTDEGDFAINTRGFEYSVNSTMLAALTKSSPATATGTYSENITGLTPNTVYYYRAYATNDCNPNKTGYSHTSNYPTFTTVHNAPTVGLGSGATSSSFVANWTAPTGGGSAAFTYEIQVDDDSNFGSVNFTANNISDTTVLVNTGLTASTTYYYRVRAVNAGGNSAWSATSLGYATTAPAPEIKIKIGSTSIGFGINLSFGSQISGTTGSENTLIIENSGDAPLSVGALSISGTDAASFIITQPLSATVAAGGTTTFTVTFAPTTMGSKTAQLSLINGDADENPFLINLFGTGTANASSDIITDNTFTYATNIDYKNYITAEITALNSVELGRFIIRDGGTGDADNVGTTLNSLGITVGNAANLERLAIYDGATEIAEMPATATTYFSGLSLFATDNGTKTFTVRGSFKPTVTDKQRITLTLVSPTASSTGSEFTTINATTSTIGNDNSISVSADRLAFTTQPTNVGINTAMANVVVAAVDINNNKDADATGTVTLTSTGTMTSSPLSGELDSGSVTFSSIVHTVAQTGRNLIAKKTGFTDLNSNLFDVTAIVYVTGDIVSTNDGTGLSYSSGWQYFNGSTLTNVPDNKGPESTSTTIATVYINHIVDGGGNADKNYNCNFVIGNGGKLTLSDLETIPSTFIAAFKKLEVLSGGVLIINGDMGVHTNGELIVRSGGTLIINSPNATNDHPMWSGNENFESGSTVTINDWKWAASATARSLVNTTVAIKNNTGGYKFGNLIIDINPTDSFVLIGGGIGVIKLCQNDLEINNSSTNYVHGASNASTAGFEIGGNMIIYDGPFSFGANFSSGTNNYTHNFIINGNFNCESNDALKINYRSNGTNTLYGTVTFRGNVTIGSNVSSITQDVSNSTRMNVILEGGNALIPKYIDIAPTAVAIPMTINNGYRKLQNHDLNLNSVTGYTTSFTLKSGATLDFGLSSTNTALTIKSISGGVGTNAFIAENGSTLKITSAGGIATSGDTGNVQTTTRTFGAADYQYTGLVNQITGTGLPTSGAKITIANTGTAPTNEVLLTNESTSVSALEITNGIFNLNEKTLTGTNLSIAENATLKIVGTQTFPTFTNKTFHNNGIVEYGGSNQSIAALTSPTYTKLKVSGTGTKVLSGTTVEATNSLAITSSLLEISEGQTLRIENEITTVDTDATNGLFIKNGGSLVQIANVDNQSSNINVGKIKMERITKPMYRLDYTYWSAPVSGNTLVALSPNSPANKFFEWNPDAVSPAPNWAVITGGTAQMLPGKGYIIRAPTSGNGTDASNPASYTPYTGNFNGKPNNGTVTTLVSGPEKWNLIGNPYPSAIDAEKFLDDNDTTLDGTLYFWTHNTPLNGASGYGYSSQDYAAWNGTGSLATVEAPNDTDPADNKPKGFIAAGQSFFVKGKANGNAVFTNSMRENANNMQFFRSSNTENTTEKHRIWLNLKGAEKGFSQTLVGYISNATNGQDNRFDGELFGGNAVTFYSVMENKNWSIQGRALPFTTADEVPLGYKTTLTGTLIINIDDRDGQLANQNIYLKDNLLNVVHNLTDGPYTFTTTPGTYDDRFVLRYLPGENLDNPTFEDQMNGLTIRKNNADIYINSSFENIDAVLIYDTTGRLLFEKEKCNTQTFKTSNVTQSEQMLIIKVRLNNGGVVTKKVW